jgi:hypothetical protein
MAAKDRSLYSNLNGDEPGVAATSRPGIFNEAVTRSSGRSNDDAGRVCAEIMRSKNLKRDGDLTQSHRALVDQMARRSSSN